MPENAPLDIDWEDFLFAMRDRKCVLFIGPEVFTDQDTGERLNDLIANEVVDKNDGLVYYFDKKEGNYYFWKDRYKRKLISEIRRFYEAKRFPRVEQLLELIARIPFKIILSFNPDSKLTQAFDRQRIGYTFDFYYKNHPPKNGQAFPKSHPFIYNLLGDINEPESLIMTPSDRFDFMNSRFQNNSIPLDLRDELERSEYYLFIGMNFGSWFTQFILRTLGVNSDRFREIIRISSFHQSNREEVARLITWEYKIEFAPLNDYEFISLLYDKCQAEGMSNPMEEFKSLSNELQSIFGGGVDKGISELKDLLAKGQTKKLLDIMREIGNLTIKEIGNDVLILTNRYNLLKQREAMGTIDQRDFIVENHRIVESLLDLIRSFEKDPEELRSALRKINRAGEQSPSEAELLKRRNDQLEQQLKELELEKEKKEERILLDAAAARKKQFAELRDKKAVFEIHQEESTVPQAREVARICEKAIDLEKADQLEPAIKQYELSINVFENYLPAWEGLERIYRKLSQEENRLRAAEKVSLIQNIVSFERNARTQVTLDTLQLEAIANYSDFSWEFNPKVNILLGRNGFGKSHLLRLILALLQRDQEISSIYFKNSDRQPFATVALTRDGKAERIHRTKTVFQEKFGKMPVLAIPDLRFVDRNQTSIRLGDQSIGNFRENSALHFLQQSPYEGLIQSFLYELCIGYLDNKKSFDLEIFQLIGRVVKELTDNEFTFSRIEALGNAEFVIEVMTEGNPNPLPIQYASQGTLSVLSIFGLIFNFLKAVRPEVPEDEVCYQPGTVVIDEIDAHLHPEWQKKIIGLLRENFPNVQFIITAHSPLVVAGCREDEVAVLKKGPDKSGFFVEKYQKDFIGEEVDDILRDVFQITETNDTLLRYQKLIPKRAELKKRIVELSGQEELTVKEKSELDTLLEDFYYLVKVAKEEIDQGNAPLQEDKE